MPLIKSPSKKAVGKNIKKEMEAGKPQKQAIAIALSTQRAAKSKHMSMGGEAGTPYGKHEMGSHKMPHYAMHAKGGVMNPKLSESHKEPHDEEIHPSEMMTDDERAHSIADAIMKKRRKMYAKGGEVDLEKNDEENRNMADDYNFEAKDHKQYDVGQLSEDPMDSNEHGDDLMDEDEYGDDLISKIRRRMASRRGY